MMFLNMFYIENILVLLYLLPKNGNDAVSAFAKTDGGPNKTTMIESKNDEWGANTKIGASFEVAWRPVTLTR